MAATADGARRMKDDGVASADVAAAAARAGNDDAGIAGAAAARVHGGALDYIG